MSDAELEAANAELLREKAELLHEKEDIVSFIGWGDPVQDANLTQEMNAIDERISVIDQQLRIPYQDRSSIPRQSNSRSPSTTLRHRAPSRWPVVEVSKPLSYEKVFPPEFLEKPMKYIVVLACHGGCDQFELPRHKEQTFTTEFDTIFTSELGMPAYVLFGSSYDYCYNLVYPFPSSGQDLVSRLQENVDSLGATKKPPRLNFKKQHQRVTDMDIFCPGDYNGLPDDGLFVFDASHPPQTVDEVKAKDLAPILLQKMQNTPRPNENGGYSTTTPSYLYKGRHVKLSDLLNPGGVLHQAGLTPENTTVIIVSCRVIIGVHEDDWCALQSPSPEAPAPEPAPAQAQQTQRSHMATVSLPRAEHEHDNPRFERMESSSDDESVSGWTSDSYWPGGRSKRQSKSKRKRQTKSKRQRKTKTKRQRKSKRQSKSKRKRQSKSKRKRQTKTKRQRKSKSKRQRQSKSKRQCMSDPFHFIQ